jgi:hypothetical protein
MPEWGRFINADAIVGNPGELLVSNMFAYCLNNPINRIDEDGYFSYHKSMYLGVGSWLALRVWGSLWNSNSWLSIGGRLYYKFTAGFIGLTAGMVFTGAKLQQVIISWLTRNTYILEMLVGAIGVKWLANRVYKKIVSSVVRKITGLAKFADRAIMRIPYATYVVDERVLEFKFII